MSKTTEAKADDTARSKCGRARLTYHPEWSPAQPWVSYVRGTAGRHYATLRAGVSDLEARGYRFDVPLVISQGPDPLVRLFERVWREMV